MKRLVGGVLLVWALLLRPLWPYYGQWVHVCVAVTWNGCVWRPGYIVGYKPDYSADNVKFTDVSYNDVEWWASKWVVAD